MAKSNTSFKPGQSGNPNGRPPKSQALTEILRAEGEQIYLDVNGVEFPAKELVARLLWQVAAKGEIQFSNDSKPTAVPFGDWFPVVQWLYNRCDGPPPKPIEVSGRGGGDIGLALNRFAGLVVDMEEDEFADFAGAIPDIPTEDSD